MHDDAAQSIDLVGRKFTYQYASNKIDLEQITETRGSNNRLIGAWTYNINGLSCATAIDADRSANGLSSVCGGIGGHSNVWALHNLIGLDTAFDEQWARAFTAAVKRATTGVTIEQYFLDVQARFADENDYMDYLVGNGQP